MNIDGWRQRLTAAVKKSDKSMRQISLAAGRGAGYVQNLLNSSKKPSLTNLAVICDVMEISLSHVLYGWEMDESEEALLRAYSLFDDDQKQAFVQLAESMVKEHQRGERDSN